MKTQKTDHREVEIHGKSYKTKKRAEAEIRKLEQHGEIGRPTFIRYFIHHNTETQRFHPVILGANNVHFAHDGFMVIA